MIDKEAIKEMTKGDATAAACEAMDAAYALRGPVALPNDFVLHDLEKFYDRRRRQRGMMCTASVKDFAAYALAQREDGAAVFVSPKPVQAVAVLNLGTPDAPGHCDHCAVWTPEPTAAYRALSAAVDQELSQQALAEWLEDWAPCMSCEADGADMPVARAVASVRSITIENLRRVASDVQALSAQRTAFESVAARSGQAEQIPQRMAFTCAPFSGLQERTFALRLSILTGGDKPRMKLRIVLHEQHLEEIAGAAADLVRAAIGTTAPVWAGTFKAS